jgi:hypothetical protein
MEDKLGHFVVPVTEDVAKGYFNVISNPMDLQTIGERLAIGIYDAPGLTGVNAFRADVELVVRNALVFNTPQDRVYKDAWRFLKAANAHFERLLPMTTDEAYRAEFAHLRAVVKDPKVAADLGISTSTSVPSQSHSGTTSSSSSRPHDRIHAF